MDALIDLAGGVRQWRTSYTMGLQDIGLRYKRSLLGPFWISASLVVTILALSYLFSGIFGQDFLEYSIWLGSGLVVWTLLSTLVNESCSAFVEHSFYLQNVPIPLSMVATRVAIRNGVVFFHNFVAVLVVLALLGARFQPVALMIFPGALLVLFFGFCTTLAVGPVCVRFRDIPQIVSSLVQITFFLTPIIWEPKQAVHRPMFMDINPFYHMIQLVRAPMLGELPTQLDWTYSLGTCGAAAVVALISVSLTRKRVVLWL